MPAPPQSINAPRVLLTLLYLNLNLPGPQPVPPCQQLLASPHSLSSTHPFLILSSSLHPQLPVVGLWGRKPQTSHAPIKVILPAPLPGWMRRWATPARRWGTEWDGVCHQLALTWGMGRGRLWQSTLRGPSLRLAPKPLRASSSESCPCEVILLLSLISQASSRASKCHSVAGTATATVLCGYKGHCSS